MRYIDKTVNKAPDVYYRKLREKKLDKTSLLAGEHPGLNGDRLFKRVKNMWAYDHLFLPRWPLYNMVYIHRTIHLGNHW